MICSIEFCALVAVIQLINKTTNDTIARPEISLARPEEEI